MATNQMGPQRPANSSSSGRPPAKKSNQKNKKPEEHKVRKEKSAVRRVFSILGKSILTLAVVGIITASIVSVVLIVVVLNRVNTDDVVTIDKNNLSYTSIIYQLDYETSTTETPVYNEQSRIYGEENSIWVDYDQMSEYLPQAAVAIEDKRFWEHSGVDWVRTAAAGVYWIIPTEGKSGQGGSTIDQQLVKNITGDNEPRVDRKVEEIFRALNMDKMYAKETILEAYLNIIPLGNQLRGVETASNYYFNKSAKDLTLTESACIASITQNPTKYDPLRHPEDNKTRRDWVIQEMLTQGYITQEQADEAWEDPLDSLVDNRLSSSADGTETTNVQGWDVDAIQDEVIQKLMEKNGWTKAKASQALYTGGYKIYSTIDSRAQSIIEEQFEESVFTSPLFKTVAVSSSQLPFNSAMVIIDSQTAEVRAIVGNTGKKSANRILSLATSGVRQPGSTIKPVAVYSLGIENNKVTYSTMFEDKALNIAQSDGSTWSPVNYYSGYSGWMTVDMAIRRSVNPVAVQTEQLVTPQASFKFMRDELGITTLVESEEINGTIHSDINLAPMSLGALTNGVTPYEWTGAYQIFMNGGYFTEPHLFSKVEDSNGNIILTSPSQDQVLSSDSAQILNQLLQNVVYGSRGTGSYAANVTGTKVACKTGTSSDNKDLWFAGGSADYTAAVWIGYADVQRSLPYSGTYPPVLAWTEVMKKIQPLAGDSQKSFPTSSDVVTLQYCTVTGLRASSTCTSTDQGYYRKSNQPALCTEADHAKILGTDETGGYMLDENGNLVPVPVESGVEEISSGGETLGGMNQDGEYVVSAENVN